MFQSTPDTLGDGRFAVGRLIRASGLARVYRGEEARTGRPVALKVLEGGFANPELRQRFIAEIRALSEIDHPRVVKVIAAGRDDALTWFAMEWLPGGSLRERLVEHGPLPPRDAARYVVETLDGLAVAHSNGIIHRDVKPSNLLLGEDGHVRLVDFGVAHHPEGTVKFRTVSGSRLGSEHYAAPEVRRDATAAGEKSDIYSAGASLFELLTALSPLRLHYTEEPEQALEPVPPAFREVVARATAYEPEDRFANTLDMREALVDAANAWSVDHGCPADAETWCYVDPDDTGILRWIMGKLVPG